MSPFLEGQSDNFVSGMYKLHSVISYTGDCVSMSWVTAFVKPGKERNWYRFSDETVTPAAIHDVLEGNFGRGAPSSPKFSPTLSLYYGWSSSSNFSVAELKRRVIKPKDRMIVESPDHVSSGAPQFLPQSSPLNLSSRYSYSYDPVCNPPQGPRRRNSPGAIASTGDRIPFSEYQSPRLDHLTKLLSLYTQSPQTGYSQLQQQMQRYTSTWIEPSKGMMVECSDIPRPADLITVACELTYFREDAIDELLAPIYTDDIHEEIREKWKSELG